EKPHPDVPQASLPDRHAAYGRPELRADRHLYSRAQRERCHGAGDQPPTIAEPGRYPRTTAPGHRAASSLPACADLFRRPGANRPRLCPAPHRPDLPGHRRTGRPGAVHLPGRAVRHCRRRGPAAQPDRPGIRRLGSRATGSGAGRQRLADLPVFPGHPLRNRQRRAPGRRRRPPGHQPQPAHQPGGPRL
ncbi:UPF0301 protein YqgE, partial [Pseudomonas sp. FEN]